MPEEGRWDSTNVFPKWRARYPDPPDLVGVTRIYERCVYLHVYTWVDPIPRGADGPNEPNPKKTGRWTAP